MWGNLPGWILSALVAVLFGGTIFWFSTPESISKPSGQFSNLAEPIKLPMSPEEALPGVMTDAENDAGELYLQAIRIYEESPRAYQQFEPKNLDRIPGLKALKWIIEGTSAKHAKIFVGKPETLVNYRFPIAELDALINLGQNLNAIGHYYVISPKNQNEELAKKYLHAGFSLGAKLYEERLNHSEFLAGIGMMRSSADSLRELAKRKGDAAREAQLKRFSDQTLSYYTAKVEPLQRKVVSAGLEDVGAYAGDVFELARTNPDQMWKVEAILKVGRYRFSATRRGDQIGANRMLGDDPVKYGYEDWTNPTTPPSAPPGRSRRILRSSSFG